MTCAQIAIVAFAAGWWCATLVSIFSSWAQRKR